MKRKDKISEEFKSCFGDRAADIRKLTADIFEIKTDNADRTAKALYSYFYNSSDCFYRYENVVFDCAAAIDLQLTYADFLSAYKECVFDEGKEVLFRQSKGKAFRFLLNEFITSFKPRLISERKNLFLDITPQGEFVAIKKSGNKSINYDLSASDRTLFYFLCFVEINKFRQFVNGEKDFSYKEKPLVLINFSDYLDEGFDYITFLTKQKSDRKINIVRNI